LVTLNKVEEDKQDSIGQPASSAGRSQNYDREMPPEPAFLSESIIDDPDTKSKYRYVFFSPCVEVFNRMLLIFQSNPDLCQNIKMAEADRRKNRTQKDKK